MSSVGQKGLQTGQPDPLLGQAEAQELVENVAGVLAEAGDHRGADAIAAQDAGVELERPA